MVQIFVTRDIKIVNSLPQFQCQIKGYAFVSTERLRLSGRVVSVYIHIYIYTYTN